MTYVRPSSLPRFQEPPVSEVRMGMVLQPLHIPVTELPSLFEALEEEYPVREEAPPRPTLIDGPSLGVAGFRLELSDMPPIPLIRFKNSDGSRWIELQSDSFTCGWRRNAAGAYPAYQTLREDFPRLANVFAAFWNEKHEDDDLYIVQANITYHNDFQVAATSALDALAAAFVVPSLSPTEPFAELPPMETASLEFTFNYTEEEHTRAVLRAHARVKPSKTTTHARFNLRYSGSPFATPRSDPESALDSTLRFMDEGHDAIVTAFDNATTSEFHAKWGRYEE